MRNVIPMPVVFAYLRGLAYATVATAGVFTVALILGLAQSGWQVFFVVAALAGGIAVWASEGPKSPEVAGALSVVAVAVLAGSVTGFGSLEIAGIVGGLMTGVWIYAGSPMVPVLRQSLFGWAGLTAVVVAGVTIILLIVDGGTLGHDESAYALKGRSWLEDTPDTGWGWHRAPALSVYAIPALAVGGEEPLLRAVGLFGVLLLAGAVWSLGTRIGGGWVGPISAVAIVAGPSVLYRGTEFLSDIPSAALLTLCMVIIWVEMGERRLPSYRLLWVLVPSLFAFYIRYQSVLSFGLIAITVLALWWRKIKLRPGPVLAVVGLGVLGLVPHFLNSIAVSGSALGILRYTTTVSDRDFVGSGLIDYVGLLLWRLSGFVGPVAAVALLVGLVVLWRAPELRRKLLFLAIPAIGQVLILGTLAHGEPRFVFFPLALVVVGGVFAFREMRLRSPDNVARSITTAVAILLVGSLGLSVAAARRSVDTRTRSNEPVQLAAEQIIVLADALECGVMTSYLPQITFYSACSTSRFRMEVEASEAVGRLTGEATYMVLIEDGKRQPSGEDLDELIEETDGSPFLVEGESRDAVVFGFSE